MIIGVGLNVTNKQPSTCIDAKLRERAEQLGLPQTRSLSVQPEVRPSCVPKDSAHRQNAPTAASSRRGPLVHACSYNTEERSPFVSTPYFAGQYPLA